MLNATQPPRRMRFSFESRCRLVSLVLAGQSPGSRSRGSHRRRPPPPVQARGRLGPRDHLDEAGVHQFRSAAGSSSSNYPFRGGDAGAAEVVMRG
jgi:hypothetical protein